MASEDKAFLKAFERELQNRAFALRLSERAFRGTAGKAEQSFWQAYHALERYNREVYEPVAHRFSLRIEPTAFTRFKALSASLAGRLLPNKSLRSGYSATQAYIPELEKLAALAPSEEAAFFDYVVAQEKCQAQAMALMIAEKIEDATAVLNACKRFESK